MGLSFVPLLLKLLHSFSTTSLIFLFSPCFFSRLSPLCVSTVSPRGHATPKPELPLTALHYCLIICGLSFEYCAVHNSWFSSFICSLILSTCPLSLPSLTAARLLYVTVVSGNLIATFQSCTASSKSVDSPSSSSGASRHQTCVRTSGAES